MLSINLELSDEELSIISNLSLNKSYLFKSLIIDGHTIGSLEVSPTSLVGSDYKYETSMLRLLFLLGSHSEVPNLKYSAKLKYTVLKEHLHEVLFGEHLLVNTIGGERIKINITKQKTSTDSTKL